MQHYISRKCNKCKDGIIINKESIDNVIYFNGKYYHKECFIQVANLRIQSHRGKYKDWQNALDHIDDIQQKTKSLLQEYIYKDMLNYYLLNTKIMQTN